MIVKRARLWPDSATILERSKYVFFQQWAELLRVKRTAMHDLDPTVIHDLRIVSRRFRAVLELFYPLVPKGSKTELRKNVRKLTRALAKLQNMDEAHTFFKLQEPMTLSLCRRITELRSTEEGNCLKALKGFYHNHLDREVHKMANGINEHSITKRNSISILAYFSDISIRQYMPIHQHLAGATLPEHQTTRRALRIAIKKWHHFFEIIAPILDCDYSKILAQLQEYQTLLERLNSITEFEELVRNVKLLPNERKYADTMLLEEENRLLKTFAELIERKPLAYTFLI